MRASQSKPESVPDPMLEFMVQETDHYFQAELGHDQRASWLLALDSALLIGLSGCLISIRNGEMKLQALPWFQAALVVVAVSLIFVVLSLWPLAGRKASFWPLRFTSKRPSQNERSFGSDWVRIHYAAHRFRASKKATICAWAVLTLIFGICLAAIALIIGSRV
jgi:hypothetical protein